MRSEDSDLKSTPERFLFLFCVLAAAACAASPLSGPLLRKGVVVSPVGHAAEVGAKILRSGGIAMEMAAAVPSALVLIIQGLIVVMVAGAAWWLDRPEVRR